MSIIAAYSTTSAYTGPPLDLSKMDGTARYLSHYENLLVLQFFHTKGTRLEKQDAALEMVICERKMAFWRRHPLYIHADALKGIAKLKKPWAE